MLNFKMTSLKTCSRIEKTNAAENLQFHMTKNIRMTTNAVDLRQKN